MHFAKTLVLGILLAAVPVSLLAQGASAGSSNTKPAASASAKPAQQPAKPAAPAPSKPAAPAKSSAPASAAAPQAAKPAANPPAKAPVGQTPKPTAKPAKKPAVKKAKATKASAPATSKAPAESEVKIARRDPFESLIGRDKSGGGPDKNLPPGKAGLQVSTLRLDGVVKAPNGMIAVVSNPQSRTYFLREGDQLYDGQVEKIAMDGVSFHEIGKDAFGKPVERQVNKRIYSSPGEQQ